MSINCKQLREYIIRPTLIHYHMWSESAENLLLGTCAQESAMGTFIVQHGGGPALGIYQMEPDTHKDIWLHYINYRDELRNDILHGALCDDELPIHETLMISDMAYATIMARLHYIRVPVSLPEPDDIKGMANYWKRYYNTPKGKGTIDDFVNSYKRYVSRGT